MNQTDSVGAFMKTNISVIDRGQSGSLLVVLTVFVCTRFIYTDFNIKQFLGYGVLLFFLLLSFRNTFEIQREKYLFIALAVSVLACVALPNYNFDKRINAYMIVLLLFLLYYIITNPGIKDLKMSVTIFQITAIIFALLILFFKLFPTLYWSGLYRILSDITREEASIYVKRGYGIPIGGEYPYGNFVMSFGAIISFSRAMFIKTKRQYHVAAFSIIVLGLLFTGRRSEPLTLLLVLLIMTVLIRRNRTHKKRRFSNKQIFWGFFGVCLLVALILVASNSQYLGRIQGTIQQVVLRIKTDGFFGALQSMIGGEKDITSGRGELWGIAFQAFLANPLLGIGWGQFVNRVPDAFNAQHGRSQVANVHNDYLQHFCECGIVMGMIITVLTIRLLRKSVVCFKQTMRNQEGGILPEILLSSVGLQFFFCILGLIDPCFYNSSYWGFYTVAIILMTNIKRINEECCG